MKHSIFICLLLSTVMLMITGCSSSSDDEAAIILAPDSYEQRLNKSWTQACQKAPLPEGASLPPFVTPSFEGSLSFDLVNESYTLTKKFFIDSSCGFPALTTVYTVKHLNLEEGEQIGTTLKFPLTGAIESLIATVHGSADLLNNLEEDTEYGCGLTWVNGENDLTGRTCDLGRGDFVFLKGKRIGFESKLSGSSNSTLTFGSCFEGGSQYCRYSAE